MRTTPLPSRRLLVGAGLLVAGLGGSASMDRRVRAPGAATRTRAGLAFGTTFALTLAGPDPAALDAALDAGVRAIRVVETAASLFRADSALARLNRDGRIEAPDPHLVRLLRFALDLAARTDGAFDPTVQPLWPIWSEAAVRGERPTTEALQGALARVGWHGLDVGDDRVRLEAGQAVTLNALVQGYAVDRVMAVVRAHGIDDAFLDTGEFGALGTHADGSPWRLGLADPRDPGRIIETITPFAGFAATSGDAMASFSPDHADHHIFVPGTGRSPRGVAAVTVTAPSGLVADGLSTACMVLGPERGRALVAGFPGCTARFTIKA